MELDDVKRAITKHFAVLNRLESHLGCVICRGPLVDGVCPESDEHLAAMEEPE